MDITEQAKQYAEGKILGALTTAVEEAYAAGYRAGYSDGMANHEPQLPQIVEDGVTYVDLGLPSGTLWSYGYYSKDYTRTFIYEEASKLNIPTLKQFRELKEYCHARMDEDLCSFINTQGKNILLFNAEVHEGGYVVKKNGFRFWLRGGGSGNKMKPCAYSNSKEHFISVDEEFMGYKLPVMLVKSKK